MALGRLSRNGLENEGDLNGSSSFTTEASVCRSSSGAKESDCLLLMLVPVEDRRRERQATDGDSESSEEIRSAANTTPRKEIGNTHHTVAEESQPYLPMFDTLEEKCHSL